MIEVIQQAVKPHDKYQVEIKLDYELLEEQDTRYLVSTYIFIPQSLDISADSYHRHQFYRDVQNYIRLKTPLINLVELSENTQMPLALIGRIIQRDNWNRDPALKTQIINNCKLLSAMLKSALRDHFTLIEQRINNTTATAQANQLIHTLVETFIHHNVQIIDQYRTYFAAFNLPHIDDELFTAYQLTDESISLLIEESAIEMFQIVSTHFTKGQKDEFLKSLSDLVAAETTHRRRHGYESILQQGSENEVYAFRASVLKKYAASVLYLSTAVSREGRTIQQVLLALAAGVSMIFATVIAFYFQSQYGSFTFPVFVALVIGYMFKDRIKELARYIFNKRLQNRLFDRRTNIKTPDGRYKLGILREKVTFVTEKDLPKPVLRARNKDLFVDLDNDGQSEAIICYTKEITLYANAFQQAFSNFPHVSGLNDIIRYDIRAYLNKMADPVQERLYIEDGRLHTMVSHKVYHLNVISRYRALQPQKEKLHTRLRIVLTRKGIKRIEHISI